MFHPFRGFFLQVEEFANSCIILIRFIGVFGRTSFALFMALYLSHFELNGSSFTPDLSSSLAFSTLF